jgi:hypothetical protein
MARCPYPVALLLLGCFLSLPPAEAAAGSGDALPPRLSLLIRRGHSSGRWVHFEVSPSSSSLTLVGCETEKKILSCRRTRRVDRGRSDREALARLWSAAEHTNVVCRMRISMADWLPFELSWQSGNRRGWTPQQMHPQIARCMPHANLAWWLLQRWDGK